MNWKLILTVVGLLLSLIFTAAFTGGMTIIYLSHQLLRQGILVGPGPSVLELMFYIVVAILCQFQAIAFFTSWYYNKEEKKK